MTDLGPGSYFIPYPTIRATTHEELGLTNVFYFAYCDECGEYIGVVHEPDLKLLCPVCAPNPSWAPEAKP